MKNFFNKKFSTKTKLISSAISLMLIVCFAITGTVAWLIDTSGPVEDTFTFGKVDIELYDGDSVDDATLWVNSEHTEAATAKLYVTGDAKFKMIPGATIDFNPGVRVKAKSEDCYVFVKITYANTTFGSSAEEMLDYNMYAGWTALDVNSHPGVYYWKDVVSYIADKNQDFQIFENGEISVNDSLTMSDIAAGSNIPSITITGYAIQADHLTDATPAGAWALIQQNPPAPYNP